MNTAYIGVGSNLGDRLGNLRKAKRLLSEKPGFEEIRTSPFYETEPVGGPADSPKYLNGVWEIKTGLSPAEMLEALRDIENTFGRTREYADAPRTLDLDLLVWGDMVLDEGDLKLPHPRMHERFFVMKPFSDLAPQWVHPGYKKSAKQLMEALLANPKEA